MSNGNSSNSADFLYTLPVNLSEVGPYIILILCSLLIWNRYRIKHCDLTCGGGLNSSIQLGMN